MRNLYHLVKSAGLVILLFSVIFTIVTPSTASTSGTSLFLDDITRCSETSFQDQIPSIDEPSFVSKSSASSYLSDSEEILGIKISGEFRAYPLKILRYHEIVNDQSSSFAVTYCPLTGTGLNYDTANIGGSNLGVTGFLFENNLVFYDRETNSCWIQMLSVSLTGSNAGRELETIPVAQTTFKTWKTLHPDTIVLSADTGFSFDYEENRYDIYAESGSIYHDSNYQDGRAPYNWYHPKERTLIVNHLINPYLFPFTELTEDNVVNFEVNNKSSVLIYDEENSYWSVFQAIDDQNRSLSFNSSD